MQIKIQKLLILKLRRFPGVKRFLLCTMDFYYEYRPRVVGTVIRIPAYIKHILTSQVIAKPGTLSFKGGAFNPGALILDDNRVLLLARSQVVPWFRARDRYSHLYLVGEPVVFIVNSKTLKTEAAYTIKQISGFAASEDYALEDFRLFTWKGKRMINHSLITKQRIDGFSNQKSVQSVLSCFNETEKSFSFCALPKVDFVAQNFEKNWVYKEHGDRLFLFYSISPYKVLVLEDENDFAFKTIIDRHVSKKLSDPGGFGTMVSFSTNPIDFDGNHWLTIIHQIKYTITGRMYFHWAVLIDRVSFLPVQISSTPIFNGMGARGRVPGYRYISAILKIDGNILFFAGEGDVYVTVTKKKITELQSLFESL